MESAPRRVRVTRSYMNMSILPRLPRGVPMRFSCAAGRLFVSLFVNKGYYARRAEIARGNGRRIRDDA